MVGKRTKLILGIILGAIVLFSGAIFGLAKFGVINLKGLADPLYGRVEITLDPSNTGGGGISIYQNGNSFSATGSYSGNLYIIQSLPYGNYTYQFGMPGNGQPCIGPIANLSHYSTKTTTTYAKFICGPAQPIPTCGDKVCGTNQHCKTNTNYDTGQTSYFCVDNCTSSSCATQNATCNATTHECEAIQSPIYKLTGNVYGDSNNMLTDATILVIDKTDPEKPYEITRTSTTTGTFDGRGYLTNPFERKNLDNLYIKFYAPNYQAFEIKLSDTGVLGSPILTAGYEFRVVKDFALKRLLTSGNIIIKGQVTDQSGTPVGKNSSVYLKWGGWPRPMSFHKPADFVPYQYNAVTDTDGNYKVEIPKAELAGNIKIDVCAMIDKYPTSPVNRDWNCYGRSDTIDLLGLTVVSGGIYENINIVLSNYSLTGTDFSKFNIVGIMGNDNILDNDLWVEAYCKSCGKGPWQVDWSDNSPYEPPDDYAITDVYNIAQPGSSASSINIRLKSRTDQRGLAYFDLNNNYINDDPEEIEIKPSDILSSAYIGSDNRLYLKKDLNIRTSDETKEKFVVFGKVYEGENTPVTAAILDIFAPGNREINETSSSPKFETQQNILSAISSSEFNIFSMNLNLKDDTVYTLDFKPPINYQLSDNTQYKIQISKKDLKYDYSRKFYYYKVDYKLIPNGVFDYVVDFYAISKNPAEQPLPITDFKTQTINYNNFRCTYSDNTFSACLIKWEYDAKVANRIHYKLDASSIARARNAEILFMSNKYNYNNGDMLAHPTAFPVKVYLSSINPNETSTCKTFNGIEFCISNIDPAHLNQIFVQKKSKLEQIATAIKGILSTAGATSYPVIHIIAADQSNNGVPIAAFAGNNRENIGSTGAKQMIGIYEVTLDRSELIPDVAHELSHTLDNLFPYTRLQQIQFNNALKAAQNSNCDSKYFESGCFATYGIRTNERELRASFMSDYLMNNAKIKAAISNPLISTECRNVLKFLYQSMKNRFPNLATYQVSQVPTTLFFNNSNSRVAGVTSTQSEFEVIMSSSGFEKTEKANFEPGLSLNNWDLTPDQIADGYWLKENYNRLPAKEKLKNQISMIATTGSQIIASASVNIQTALDSVNLKIESLLARLGFKITTASISGHVEDYDDTIAGLEVSFGNKIAVTDAFGKYKISKVPSGNFKFAVSDPKINKTYNVQPTLLTIADDEQKTIDVFFNRPSFTLKGQVFQGGAALSNGRMTVDGIQTINLDAKGKFNFRLKQGQHKIVIKNKTGKTLSVTNAGTYDNLGNLQVTHNFDSLIWVK
ncbi:MAG: hypothetical protein WCG99_01065 [Candidatus Berkelbacteria bacterium]